MACGLVLGQKNRINLTHTDGRFDSANALGCELFFPINKKERPYCSNFNILQITLKVRACEQL